MTDKELELLIAERHRLAKINYEQVNDGESYDEHLQIMRRAHKEMGKTLAMDFNNLDLIDAVADHYGINHIKVRQMEELDFQALLGTNPALLDLEIRPEFDDRTIEQKQHDSDDRAIFEALLREMNGPPEEVLQKPEFWNELKKRQQKLGSRPDSHQSSRH